jgi:hypothetical protein
VKGGIDWNRGTHKSLQSESPFAIEQIESFAKNLHLLPELAAICDGTRSNQRSFLLFLLMITSVPNFAQLMEKNAKLVQAFSNGVKQLLPRTKDINTTATLCIAWHNLCLLISSENQLENVVVQNLVKGGAEALVSAWSYFKDSADRELKDLLTAAFCHVIVNDRIRPIVVEIAKDAGIDDLIFMRKLEHIDGNFAVQTFGENNIQPSIIPMVDAHRVGVWHADVWKKHVSGLVFVWK